MRVYLYVEETSSPNQLLILLMLLMPAAANSPSALANWGNPRGFQRAGREGWASTCSTVAWASMVLPPKLPV